MNNVFMELDKSNMFDFVIYHVYRHLHVYIVCQ